MPPSRFTNLDILRGFAALAVALFHFNGAGFSGIAAIDAITNYGEKGVEVFFVISGYVIPLSLYRANYRLRELGSFLAARFIRLYPAYVLTALLAVGLWYLSAMIPGFRGEAPIMTARLVFGNLFLACGFLREEWILPIFWTLAIEAQYYLLIGISFGALISKNRVVRRLVVAGWIVAPLMVRSGPTVLAWTALFAMGMVGFLWQERLVSRVEAVGLLVATVMVHWVVRGPVSAGLGAVTLLIILFAPEIKSRALVGLGTISYSLYLLHIPVGQRVVNLTLRLTTEPVWRMIALLGAVAVAILAAAFFYHKIEKPSHELARKVRERLKLSGRAEWAGVFLTTNGPEGTRMKRRETN